MCGDGMCDGVGDRKRGGDVVIDVSDVKSNVKIDVNTVKSDVKSDVKGGDVNDGFKGGADPNGGLPDTMQHMDPAIDSFRGEDRVDTEKRDTVPR